MSSVPPSSGRERPAREESEALHDGDDLGALPTTDPMAALRFCRSLARLLTPHSVHDLLPEPPQPGRPWQAPKPELSVVIPVYNEEENLPTLHARLTEVLSNTVASDYELVFVDDGSHDQSPGLLKQFAAEDVHVVVVELARNFGHQVAISAGLDYSLGRAVVVMDADLQDPPEVVPQLIAKWREGHEVVYAVRAQRKEVWWKRLAYAAFYTFLDRMARIAIPRDAGDFCLMDRRVVNALVTLPERNRFIRGMRSWVGFTQVGIPYERHARHAGRPKYTVAKLFGLALDGLFSFSHMPLRAISLLGLCVSLLSLGVAGFYGGRTLLHGFKPPGFATLVVAIFLLAGVQLLTLGLIGEYVGRTFEEVKRRPLYVARRVLGRHSIRAS